MNGNGTRSPDLILTEIEQTRSQMDSTLEAIEKRLTPGELLDQGLNYLRNSGGREFISNLGASVKGQPLPASLVGIGLAWLMVNQQIGRDAVRVSSAPDTSEKFERARSQYRQMLQDQPLALGIVGLAIGALVAAAAPRVRQRDEVTGKATDDVKENPVTG